jgi:uncharacterized protein YjbI with pentapeptide repeats
MTRPESNAGADLDNQRSNNQYRRMEDRLAVIETDLAKVKVGIANVQENSATRADLAEVRAGIANLQENSATKADLAEVRAAIANLQENSATRADLAEVKAGIANLKENSATKADLAEMEGRMLKTINTQTWRFVTWMTSVMALGFAGVYFIARNVH